MRPPLLLRSSVFDYDVEANCVRPHDYREDNINGICKKKKNTLRGL